MPIPIKLLTTKYGLDAASLKAAFNEKTITSRPKVKKLRDNICDCIRNGINRNRRDYRLYAAMDWAMDQPFYQISYTQLRGLLSNQPDDKKVLETVNSWGLTHLLPDVIGTDGKPCCDASTGKPKKAINLPFLTNIFIPVVMAYHTIRWAKLFNDRNLIPLYKYEPAQFTKENRFRGEVMTQVVNRQADWFGYTADLKQNINQTLQYGICINFPREAWYAERQLNGDGKEKIVREGLRFNMPHPSRLYYDLYHRVSSLNTNSGCEYTGYWEIQRYKTVNDNPLYWNKDSINKGATSWFDAPGASDFLSTVYPCSMSFPVPGSSMGVGALDRQSELMSYYSEGDSEAATLITQHFHKIVPVDYGLGTYKYPAWFRFVFASDNAVLWAEPLAYDRFPTYAYDADFNRSRFRSMSLEIMPFQDQIGNILSQWNAAVRENLRNPVFVDREKVPTNALIALMNQGNKTYSGREYIPFSSTENYRLNVNQKEAFFTPQLTHHSTGELATLITAILDMLDRVMQLSPQEIGQAASHEQTAEESKIIANNMSTRVQFTGSFLDEAEHAKKVMIYDANMEYADESVTVGISTAFTTNDDELKKLAEKVGFTIQDETDYSPDSMPTTRQVSGKKTALQMELFSSSREADTRIDNAAVADAMSKIFLAVANNEYLVQSIGAPQLVDLMNQIITTSGLVPKEFRLVGKPINSGPSPEDQQKQLESVLKGLTEQVRTAIDKSQQETIQAAGQQTMALIQKAMETIGQQVQPVAQAVGQANQVNQVQQQQLEQLAAAVVKMEQAIAAVAQQAMAAQQPFNPPMPPNGGGGTQTLNMSPAGSVPVGVPV